MRPPSNVMGNFLDYLRYTRMQRLITHPKTGKPQPTEEQKAAIRTAFDEIERALGARGCNCNVNLSGTCCDQWPDHAPHVKVTHQPNCAMPKELR